jgi:hypothetical protein
MQLDSANSTSPKPPTAPSPNQSSQASDSEEFQPPFWSIK